MEGRGAQPTTKFWNGGIQGRKDSVVANKRRGLRMVFRNARFTLRDVLQTKVAPVQCDPQETNAGRQWVQIEPGRRVFVDDFSHEIMKGDWCFHDVAPGLWSIGGKITDLRSQRPAPGQGFP